MNKVIKWIVIFFAFIVFISIFAGEDKNNTTASVQSSSPDDTQTTPTPPPETVNISARQLHEAYEENEVATDENLRGKIVIVKGVVDSIDKDFTDSIIVSLKTGNEFMSARMEMKDSEKQIAINLKKGDKVKVICERLSRVMGSPSGRDCVFN